MIVCKAFEPGLVCRGYQFHVGLNTTDEANCRHNGFHCAANPLDCLSYYSNMDRAEYWLVDAGGDVDEDEYDSKVSCTELTILKQLSRKDFFMFALAYMCDHPLEKWNKRVNKEHGIAENGFVVVRGVDPRAKGKRGDILALAKESPDGSKILQIGLATVDGKSILANTWYGVDLKKRRFASQSQCA